jgi:hypothetical protein
MRKGYAFAFLVVFLAALSLFSFPQASGEGHTIQIRLSINNTSNTVYIPGVGETPSGGLGPATYEDPPHYYLASYSGSYLTGLVAAVGNSLSVSSAPGHHTLEMDQDEGGKALLVFSQGYWDSIEKVILSVENGKFLGYPSPSFGFGLGDYYPVAVMLSYPDIDIEGTLDQSKGSLKLAIENTGVSGEKPVVRIRKS